MNDWLTPEQILRIPSERFGIFILHRLTKLSANNWGMHNFTVEYLAATMPSQPLVTSVHIGDQLQAGREDITAKIADAWTWLEQKRYLVPTGRPGEQWRQLTDRGREILTIPADDALKRIQASEALGTLHPRIDRQARDLWNAGDFATAIFTAAREIEIAHRLSDLGRTFSS